MIAAAWRLPMRKTCHNRTLADTWAVPVGVEFDSSRDIAPAGLERPHEFAVNLAPGAIGSSGYRVEAVSKALIEARESLEAGFRGLLYSIQEVVMHSFNAKSLRALVLVITVASSAPACLSTDKAPAAV